MSLLLLQLLLEFRKWFCHAKKLLAIITPTSIT